MTTEASKCAVYEPLISGALDGELTQQEQQHLQLHIAECAKCQRLYTELEGMQQQLRAGIAPTHPLHQPPVNRAVRCWPLLGWLLLLLGVLPLLGYAGYQLLTDPQLPVWVRLAMGSMILGAVVLFIYVARQRVMAARTDNYKKVKL
ncbi:zf-HC2 domain-containing protein [Pseudidiomarina sp. 1APP75-27a]|uniref:zf-HC2 domain-containing protein n=1 Tax=Pseudidiomarina terrestris TaxID=2820060 RepID=UPI002B0589B5|nr:zf-HC2 domain-containing protein [Pseudidiomarina sp. 1APP75-27a]MEA3587000.1 zf-HC2 domain-containing protein [Pseudidiomarina sp. 1APP75-27a]